MFCKGEVYFKILDIQMNTEIDHEGVDKRIEEKQHIVHLEKDSLLAENF